MSDIFKLVQHQHLYTSKTTKLILQNYDVYYNILIGVYRTNVVNGGDYI